MIRKPSEKERDAEPADPKQGEMEHRNSYPGGGSTTGSSHPEQDHTQRKGDGR